jgi:hypothetical protein
MIHYIYEGNEAFSIGGLMTTISNSQFFAGTRFVDGLQVPTYWAVRPDRSEVIACANIASARAISEGRAPSRADDSNTFTYKAVPFVSPTGQYYVEIHAGMQKVRMDVANAQTARHYGRNGVDTQTTVQAYLENLNQ